MAVPKFSLIFKEETNMMSNSSEKVAMVKKVQPPPYHLSTRKKNREGHSSGSWLFVLGREATANSIMWSPIMAIG